VNFLTIRRLQGKFIIEVASHLNSTTVRGVVLTATRGLWRGSRIIDTGQTLQAPVGERVLGRVFDVFDAMIDRKEPIEGGEWRSITSPPVPLMRRSTTSEVFVTGIKAIDLLAPLERGGKSGLFGGGGVGKTVLIMELTQHDRPSQRRQRVLWNWRSLPRGRRAVSRDPGGRCSR
jgi:F-type H+-transporting ATPase subunit beta